jgi:hypothetical protein
MAENLVLTFLWILYLPVRPFGGHEINRRIMITPNQPRNLYQHIVRPHVVSKWIIAYFTSYKGKYLAPLLIQS